MIVFVLGLLAAGSAQGTVLSKPIDLTPIVQEASLRTGVPEPVIRAVIDVESRWRVRAISPKGAIGLMQLMPETWSMLRNKLTLGTDAFDPHDNIIAGTYYLRSLYDQYGWEGVFVAYNAGPGRYEAYRDLARPLATETRAYVTHISEKLEGKTYAFANRPVVVKPVLWTEASLFISDADSQPIETTGLSPIATPFVTLPPPVDLPGQ